MLTTVVRALSLLALIASLSGCVVGQQLRLDAVPEAQHDAGPATPVLLQVEDQRELVTSGKKKPWYVGQYRAGLGNPWSVSTDGKVALAEQLEQDLAEELASLGFVPGQDGNQLQVTIREWDFTGYQNGRFWYELDIVVRDGSQKALARHALKDEIPIRGTFMLGARGGFERDMPGIYDGIVRSIVRANPDILQALATKGPE